MFVATILIKKKPNDEYNFLRGKLILGKHFIIDFSRILLRIKDNL